MRKSLFFLFVVSLALFAGQAHAQRCLPKMKGIRLTAGMADGFYSPSSKNETGYSFGASLATYKAGINGCLGRSISADTTLIGRAIFLWSSSRAREVSSLACFQTEVKPFSYQQVFPPWRAMRRLMAERSCSLTAQRYATRTAFFMAVPSPCRRRPI